jgi:hypothetical protein
LVGAAEGNQTSIAEVDNSESITANNINEDNDTVDDEVDAQLPLVHHGGQKSALVSATSSIDAGEDPDKDDVTNAVVSDPAIGFVQAIRDGVVAALSLKSGAGRR